MNARLPTLATALGLAGLLPFVFASVAAIRTGPSQAAGVAALLAYAAVILAFLGGVHWGFALSPEPGAPESESPVQSRRLALGVVPSLIGWAALLLAQAIAVDLALAVLIAGFVFTVVTEARAAASGFVPGGYMRLRWGLSVVVVMCLVTVLTLRLIGASIVF